MKLKFASTRSAGTRDPKAHDLVLKGRAAADLDTVAGLYAAKRYYEQALAQDRGYADAYAGLAFVYLDLAAFSELPRQRAFPKGRAAARQALAIDPRNAAALVALATMDVMGSTDGAHRGLAKRLFLRALALEPSDAGAHVDYGLIVPLRQSLAQEQEGSLLAPRSIAARRNIIADYISLHEYPLALAQTNSPSATPPSRVASHPLRLRRTEPTGAMVPANPACAVETLSVLSFRCHITENSIMAVLTIRNLPDEVRDSLRQRAASAGMSMEAQARAILAQASKANAAQETAASLQHWVDDLYAGRKPRSAVGDLLATRRSEARAERSGARKPRPAAGTQG